MRIEKRKEVGLLVHRTTDGKGDVGTLIAVVSRDGSAFLGRVREKDLVDDPRGTVLRVYEDGTRLDEPATIVSVYSIFVDSNISCMEVPSSSVFSDWRPAPKTRWLRWTSMHSVGGGAEVAVRVPVGGEATEEVVVPWEYVRGPYLRVELLGSNALGDSGVLLPAPSVRGLRELWVPSACLVAELPETTWAESVKTNVADKKAQNYAHFRAILPELLGNPLLLGKYAVICDEEVQAVYDTFDIALRNAVRAFSMREFIIQQIVTDEETRNSQ